MRVIFLDIDGVLNNIPSLNKAGMQGVNNHLGFDPACVARVKRIIEETGAKLVISSSWRFGMDDVLRSFTAVDLPAPTDRTTLEDLERSEQILLYLQSRPEIVDWVAIDDDHLIGLPPDRVARTTYQDGLTDEGAELAIRILRPAVIPVESQ